MPALSLSATIAGETSLSSPLLSTYATCDGAGNVYTRHSPGAGYTCPPIQEITAEARLGGIFSLPESYPDGSSAGFVDHDGRVYLVAPRRSGVDVVEFAADGSVRAKTRLTDLKMDHLTAWHLAVFKSGEYLLAGQTGKNLRTPFTAVFAADGRLVKEVYEPEDEEARSRAEAGDPKFGPSAFSNRFVSRGDVAAGADGNVYLLHGVSPRSSM